MFELSEILFWVLIIYIIFFEDDKSNSCIQKEVNKWRLKNILRD